MTGGRLGLSVGPGGGGGGGRAFCLYRWGGAEPPVGLGRVVAVITVRGRGGRGGAGLGARRVVAGDGGGLAVRVSSCGGRGENVGFLDMWAYNTTSDLECCVMRISA